MYANNDFNKLSVPPPVYIDVYIKFVEVYLEFYLLNVLDEFLWLQKVFEILKKNWVFVSCYFAQQQYSLVKISLSFIYM